MDSYYRGDIEGSLGLLESATSLDPDFANAYAYLALVNFALRREEDGFAAAERAFALRGRVNERARYEAERIYYIACGDYARSLERGRVLAALFPREAPLHRSLAQAYSSLEKLDDALRHARLAVSLDPDNPSGRMLLAGILAQANRPEEALRIAAEGHPSHDNPLPYLGQGFALLMDGKIEAAQDSFDKLNQIADLDPVGKQYRAAGLVLAGRLAEACEQLDAEIDVAVVRKHRSEETVRRYWLGQIGALRADAAAASRQARTLADLPATPPFLEALRQGCEIAAACGDAGVLQAAAGKLDRIRKAYPSTRSEGFFQQATGLLESCVKGSVAARGSLSRAYAVWPDISNAWSLAENLRVLGQYGDAIGLYERIAAAKGTALRFDGVVLWVCSLAMAARCHHVLKNCGTALTRLNEFLGCWGATPGVPLVNATRSECASCINER
jgi:tetratricopeptide (TPR) repeat protein